MADFEQIRKLCQTAIVAGGVDEYTIQEAETTLGVRFPASYRKFLSEFGAALCTGFEIAGLFKSSDDVEPPLWSHVVKSTIQLRQKVSASIPYEYVLMSDDGGDYKYYLDTAQRNELGECPIVMLGPGAETVTVANDFVDFVKRSFNGSLSS